MIINQINYFYDNFIEFIGFGRGGKDEGLVRNVVTTDNKVLYQNLVGDGVVNIVG